MRDFLNKFRPKFMRRMLKSESGATAVEFGLVAFPFFMLLGCICETGIMLFSEYAIQSGVQDASRLIRTGQAQTAGMNAAAFKAKICATAGIVFDCAAGLTVYVRPSTTTFAGLQSVLPSYINVGPTDPTSYNCGLASNPVGVIATYDWKFTMPFMQFLGNIAGGTKRRLSGIAIFQNEPFATTGTC